MRILMLGNSFTYFNDLPTMLADLTGAEVVQHTRGGALLEEQLDPDSEMGASTLYVLNNEKWDYVVMQEMSCGPITHAESFRRSVRELCPLIRAAGAVPVLYATWAYHPECARLAEIGMSAEQMLKELTDAYSEAARETGSLLAPVGTRFAEEGSSTELYDPADLYHPSAVGSRVAAVTIARVIQEDRRGRRG